MRFYKLLEFDPLNPTAIMAQTVNFDYSDMSDVVHRELRCDYIETATVKIAGRDFVMLVDGEGAVGDESPARNVNIPAWFFYSGLDQEKVIYGDVLIGKEDMVDGEPDVVGLSDKDLFDIAQEIEILSSVSAMIDKADI